MLRQSRLSPDRIIANLLLLCAFRVLFETFADRIYDQYKTLL